MKTRRLPGHPASLAALCLFLACSSCSSPGDEAWLRVTGFRASGDTDVVGVINASLSSEDERVDIGLTNMAGKKGEILATGIYISRVEARYRFGSASLPASAWGVSLYIPAPGDTGTTEEWLTDVPIVNRELKTSLAGVASGPFTVQAEVTVTGETDDGKKVSATGSLAIRFSGGGSSGGSNETITMGTLTASPNPGTVSEAIILTSGVATSNLGHTVEYWFDFDDGEELDWLGASSTTHIYDAAGDYVVTEKVRCSIHNSVQSASSVTLTITND